MASYNTYNLAISLTPAGFSIPSSRLLERLLPVFDVICDNFCSLISREVATNSLDKVALGIYKQLALCSCRRNKSW